MPIDDGVLRKRQPGLVAGRAGQRHFGAEVRRDLERERAEHRIRPVLRTWRRQCGCATVAAEVNNGSKRRGIETRGN